MKPSRIFRVLAIVGVVKADRERKTIPGMVESFFASLLGRLAILVVIFLAVPVALYFLFSAADQDKKSLLISNVAERGRLITEILRPRLEEGGLENFSEIRHDFASLAGADAQIKLMFRPVESANTSRFFYVASAPEVGVSAIEAERQKLQERGILAVLAQSCDRGEPMTMRYQETSPPVQIITSVTPLTTKAGCWTVVTAYSTSAYLRSSIGRPYWTTPEVRFAAIIYATMALLTVTIMLGVWHNLRRISRLARVIRLQGRQGRKFAEENVLTEVGRVADELDRLVAALEQSAKSIREAAEENAHAYKTPLAVISQSVAPLRRIVPPENERGQGAIDRIENAVEKLDDLIAGAWQMDELVANLLDPPRDEMDLSALVRGVIEDYNPVLAQQGLTVTLSIMDECKIVAGEEMLETVIENLIENAAGFAKDGGGIQVSLNQEQSRVHLVVEDDGPGVPESELERIFERYYSARTQMPDRSDGVMGGIQEKHLGIGLWIVRRNVEGMGGQVRAGNRPEGGLKVTVELPISE